MTRRTSLVAMALSFVVLMYAIFGSGTNRPQEAKVNLGDSVALRSLGSSSNPTPFASSVPATAVAETERTAAPPPPMEREVRPTLSLPGASSAVAAPGPAPEAVRMSVLREARENVDVGSAERLAIKFQGFPDLTGEYRVGADGNISIPVIGRIAVAGLADAELEALLAQRLAKTTSRREAYVTVEVAEYRSVFVSGYVARPGSFSWKPGMNVLQAVALAGGMFRTRGENGIVMSEDTELARLQRSVADQKRQIAALARVRAEITGAREIEMPQRLVEIAGREEAMALIASETTVFTSRRAALDAQRAAIARGLDAARKEVKSLTDQAGRAKALLDRRRDFKEQIDRLQAKGIIRTDRSMEEMARVSDLEDRGSGINVSMARVSVLIAGLERDSITLEQGRKADLDAEAMSLERSIAQLAIEIDSARQSYRKLTGQDPPTVVVTPEGPKKIALQYEIVRPKAGSVERWAADPLQVLRPGDTLLVSAE